MYPGPASSAYTWIARSSLKGRFPKDPPDLETKRLRLRRMTLADADAVFDYASDPEVTRYVTWDTHRTVRDSEEFLRSVVSGYEAGEQADWGITEKLSGRFIGSCGLHPVPEHSRAELGYVLSREYWGRGIMPEAVRAMIRFGFEKLDLERVEARCIAENTASARVMEKSGMIYEGTLRERELIKGTRRDMKFYAILRREYARSLYF